MKRKQLRLGTNRKMNLRAVESARSGEVGIIGVTTDKGDYDALWLTADQFDKLCRWWRRQ